MKAKFNLLLNEEIPESVEPTETILDSRVENVEVRRARLIGDLAIECIHTHAFLNGLNLKTGGDARFDKMKDFVHNRFIKKTARLHHDLDLKQTITTEVRHSLESLKNECTRPEFHGALDRLCLDSATKYKDLLNANVVYLATDEKIKFADYVNNRDMGFSTILTKEVKGEEDENITREKIVDLCEKWIEALYGDMIKQSTQQKSGIWYGWTTDDTHQDRNWFEWACDTLGNALIATGNYIKIGKSDKTDKKSDTEIE